MMRPALALVGLLIAIASPYLHIPAWTPSLATVVLFTATSLVGLNLVFGYCGMLALGQAAFAAIPAYLAGILETNGITPLLAALLSVGGTVVVARLVAEIFTRLPGIYLAVGTLGFAYVVEGLARAFPSVTGGASGLVLQSPLALGEDAWYATSVVSVALATIAAYALTRGPRARRLRLVRKDELAAAVTGIDVVRVKINVFTLGATFPAIGGLLLAYYTSVVTPEMGGANTSLEYLAMVVIGGGGSLFGPVIGSVTIQWLFAAAGAAAQFELLLYGACFLLVTLFAPKGLAYFFARLADRRRAGAYGRPVGRIASAAVEPPPRATVGMGLQVERVVKRFGGLTAIDDVSLSLRPGEIVAVLGPNGAGKSTFFNIVSGIEKADGGTIRLDGTDVSREPIHRRARVVGRSFQVPRLVLDASVLENLLVRIDRLQPSWTQARRMDLAIDELERFELLDVADVEVQAVAVGRHKLIDIARASIGNPPLLLLDEPAVGLARDEIEALKRMLVSLKDAGTAIVLVEHNMDFVSAVADRILVMERGRHLVTGTPREVLDSPAVRAAYLGALG